MFGGGSAFTAERARDRDMRERDLERELERIKGLLLESERKRLEAEAHLAVMRRNVAKPRVVPAGDADSGYECPVAGCYASLSEDYRHCPGCGSELDWRTWAEPDEPEDWRSDRLRDKWYDEALEAG